MFLNLSSHIKETQQQETINNLAPVSLLDESQITPEPTSTTQLHPNSNGSGNGSPRPENTNSPEVSFSENNNIMELFFLDTGNSDSSLLKLPDGKNILFDCGDTDDGQSIVEFLHSNNVYELSAVVLSHMHSDHGGGCKVVADNFNVDTWYIPNIPDKYVPTTVWFQNLIETLVSKNVNAISPNSGEAIASSDSYNVFFLNSVNGKDYGDDQNAYSLVVMIEYGNHKYVIGGDALKQNESEILQNWGSVYNLDVDVMKGNHHCSKTSNSESWIRSLKPEHIVCTVGKNNDYNHPHQSVINLFKKYDINVYRSDKNGTIKIIDDGENYTIEPGLESANGGK